MSGTPLPYALDDLVKDSVPFIVCEHWIMVTLDAGSAGNGDTVLNIPLCLDRNLESTANGNLSLHLEGHISTHFSISQEGSLKVARLLWDVSGGLYQLTVHCSDRGKPETLGDELAILLHIVPGKHPCLFHQSM